MQHTHRSTSTILTGVCAVYSQEHVDDADGAAAYGVQGGVAQVDPGSGQQEVHHLHVPVNHRHVQRRVPAEINGVNVTPGVTL